MLGWKISVMQAQNRLARAMALTKDAERTLRKARQEESRAEREMLRATKTAMTWWVPKNER